MLTSTISRNFLAIFFFAVYFVIALENAVALSPVILPIDRVTMSCHENEAYSVFTDYIHWGDEVFLTCREFIIGRPSAEICYSCADRDGNLVSFECRPLMIT